MKTKGLSEDEERRRLLRLADLAAGGDDIRRERSVYGKLVLAASVLLILLCASLIGTRSAYILLFVVLMALACVAIIGYATLRMGQVLGFSPVQWIAGVALVLAFWVPGVAYMFYMAHRVSRTILYPGHK